MLNIHRYESLSSSGSTDATPTEHPHKVMESEVSSVHVRVPKPDVQSAGEATGSGLSTDLDVIPSPTAIPDDEAVSMDIQQVSADM